MKKVLLPFGTFKFDGSILISEMKAGVNLDAACVDDMIETLLIEYGDQPFVFLSNRVHDYSLDPVESKRIIDETNVIAAAFVLNRDLSFSSFESERVFYRIPTAAFSNLESALEWSKQKLAILKNDEESSLR